MKDRCQPLEVTQTHQRLVLTVHAGGLAGKGDHTNTGHGCTVLDYMGEWGRRTSQSFNTGGLLLSRSVLSSLRSLRIDPSG